MKWNWVIIIVFLLGILAVFMTSVHKIIRAFEDSREISLKLEIQTPKFFVRSLMQKDTSIIDLTSDKLVVLHYWATWCKPCIEDFETFQPFYQQHKDSVIFLVISEEDDETVINFLEKKNYKLPFISSRNLINPFNSRIQMYPLTFFVRNSDIKKMITGKTNWSRFNINELKIK